MPRRGKKTRGEKKLPQKSQAFAPVFPNVHANDAANAHGEKNADIGDFERTAGDGSGKMQPMKTASDVIHRILWDPELSKYKNEFVVGYLDRFIGVVENHFSAFCWDDYVTVDTLTTMAIPKHRIEYFKHGDTVVWSKKERTDLVFGSTETYNGTSVFDVIMSNGATADVLTSDEVVVGGSGDAVESHTTTTTAPPPPSRVSATRPNYFLAYRLQDDQVKREFVRAVEDVKSRIRVRRGRADVLSSQLVLVAAAHVTVCKLRVEGDKELRALTHAVEELRLHVPSASARAHIAGVGSFDSRVVYLKVLEDEKVRQMATDVMTTLRSKGFNVYESDGSQKIAPRNSGDHPLAPPLRTRTSHVTIFNLSRNTGSRVLHTRFADSSLFAPYHEHYFGCEVVRRLYLCPMHEERLSDGSHRVITSVEISSPASACRRHHPSKPLPMTEACRGWWQQVYRGAPGTNTSTAATPVIYTVSKWRDKHDTDGDGGTASTSTRTGGDTPHLRDLISVII